MPLPMKSGCWALMYRSAFDAKHGCPARSRHYRIVFGCTVFRRCMALGMSAGLNSRLSALLFIHVESGARFWAA